MAVVIVLCAQLGPLEPLLAQTAAEKLVVSANFTGGPVSRDAEIELRLNRPLQPSEGQLAILFGQTDMTNLFAAAGLAYTLKTLLLPVNETEVVVYTISATNDWKEIARFVLRVASSQNQQASPSKSEAEDLPSPTAKEPGRRFGFDKFEFIPALTVSSKAQSTVLFFPDTTRPDRINFTDFTFQGSVQTNVVRGDFNSQNQFDIVGASFQKEALRFGELGTAAPQFDLSSYLMRFQLGKTNLSVGHISYGTNRYLINNFSSRGITVSIPFGSRADLSLAAANGTSIVGWTNYFGLNQRKHQVLSSTLGFEFFKRAGGLRLEANVVHGSLLPLSNFNQGNINDAERSRGAGLRIIASDPQQRFRLDAGFARSRFANPADPLLDQGLNVAAVRETTRNARYLDVSYELLRDFSPTKSWKANLVVTYRGEHVDPLFRSVAASTQADRSQHQFDITGRVDEITFNVSHFRFNDNLANIPSILKTLTRRNTLAVALPVVALTGDAARSSVWLPRVAYTFDRTHQFAASVPVNGGFEENLSTVPDQVSTNHSFTADWQGTKWRSGYRFNRSYQDNRQIERDLSDFSTLIHGATFGLNPFTVLDLGLELTTESNHSREASRTDRIQRAALNVAWRMTRQTAVSANLTSAFAGDDGRTSKSRDAQFDVQWSWRFGIERSRFQKMQGQFFIRYANQYARSLDHTFSLNNLTKGQTFNAGLSFTFF